MSTRIPSMNFLTCTSFSTPPFVVASGRPQCLTTLCNWNGTTYQLQRCFFVCQPFLSSDLQTAQERFLFSKRKLPQSNDIFI